MSNLIAFLAGWLLGRRLAGHPAPIGYDVLAPRHGRTCARLASPLPPVAVRRVPVEWIVFLPSAGWEAKQEETTR